MKNILECQSISASYDGRGVIKGLSFAVKEGDYVCIVGENGSGKSTLMRTVLGLQRPLSGQILTGDGLRRTEIGYLELGNDVGVMLAPGELAPEILYGGVTSAEQTWLGEGWDYPSLDSVVGVETLLCFGLCNDQIGYVIPDNDFRSYLTENEEITAVSSAAASTIAEAFIELVQSLD